MIDRTVLTAAEAAFVASRRVAHLATVLPDGTPHVVPICTVLDMDRLVFASERDTQKIRNIGDDPRVAIAFDEYAEAWRELRQVIVFGRAYFVEGGPEFVRDRQLLYDAFEQYPTEAPIEEDSSVVVEVRLDRATSLGF